MMKSVYAFCRRKKNTSGYITIVRMFFLFLLHYINEKSEYVDQYAKDALYSTSCISLKQLQYM